MMRRDEVGVVDHLPLPERDRAVVCNLDACDFGQHIAGLEDASGGTSMIDPSHEHTAMCRREPE